ncbi:hypothetical protein GCM10009540_85590 [Streptomyces turgidiscabies]
MGITGLTPTTYGHLAFGDHKMWDSYRRGEERSAPIAARRTHAPSPVVRWLWCSGVHEPWKRPDEDVRVLFPEF